MSNLKDKELVLLLKKGKVRAFDALFQRYCSKLYSFVLSYTGTIEEAEDITQEVFFRVWQNRVNLDPDLSFNAYIIVVARNLVFNLFRKRLQNSKYVSYSKQRSSPINQTEEYIIFSELQHHSQLCVEKLPSRCKQIFMLSRQQGLSIKEIARKLDVSPSTVENQINKALKMIRKDLVSKKILIILLLLLASL